jgi:hypothetical protein
MANSKQNAHERIFLAGVFSVVCSVLQQLKQLQEKNHQILCMRSGAQLPELWGMADSVKCPLNVC